MALNTLKLHSCKWDLRAPNMNKDKQLFMFSVIDKLGAALARQTGQEEGEAKGQLWQKLSDEREC